MKTHFIMNGVKKLIVLAQKFAQEDKNELNVYGGYEFELPPTHKAGMVIKEGTFSCADCKFVDAENHSCNNDYYANWNGGSKKLPDAPLNKICSDWYEPQNK